jgi:formylglycine-generating enzyme required for sulfatase activity
VRPDPLPEHRIKEKILEIGTDKIGAVILPVLPEPFPPQFASDWGEDEYGLWMGIEYQGIRQGFRWLAPGSFFMGSPGTEPERYEDEIQHKVTLTHGFWLADTACTQELWQAVTGENRSDFKGKEHPVDTVSWEDCRAFLDQINKACPDLELDFPTEAQWEYACRDSEEIETGEYTPFSFGRTITTDQVNYDGNYPYADAPKGEYREKTVPVKCFAPNGRGLYQMHGNLFEWCRGWYAHYGSGSIVDPAGPHKGATKVLRGGAWFKYARIARSACRIWYEPGFRNSSIGFRFSRGQTGRRV